MRLALIGYGGVGKAFYNLLAMKHEICDANNISLNYIINSKGGVYDPVHITDQTIQNWDPKIGFQNIIDDESIDLVIELTSTSLTDGQPGLDHIRRSLQSKKHVVTGNKGPLVLAFSELKQMALQNKVKLKYGCTVGGALPTLATGIHGTRGSQIVSFEGVLNGTSNYILNLMYHEEMDFNDALDKTVELGIAEKNSSFDVEGWDTACKMIIIANDLFDEGLTLDDTMVRGINTLELSDIEYAKKHNMYYRLVGQYRKDAQKKIVIEPKLVGSEYELAHLYDKNKGILFETDTLGKIVLTGGASGTIPAAASIFRDVLEIVQGQFD